MEMYIAERKIIKDIVEDQDMTDEKIKEHPQRELCRQGTYEYGSIRGVKSKCMWCGLP